MLIMCLSKRLSRIQRILTRLHEQTTDKNLHHQIPIAGKNIYLWVCRLDPGGDVFPLASFFRLPGTSFFPRCPLHFHLCGLRDRSCDHRLRAGSLDSRPDRDSFFFSRLAAWGSLPFPPSFSCSWGGGSLSRDAKWSSPPSFTPRGGISWSF